MLTVDDYELIRRKHLVDGMSKRAIARELGYARNTVAKAVANPIPPGYRLSKPRPKPAVDPVKHIIDAWLEQDKLGRPKQRHTGQRIYERLRDEHNFKGSATAVRRYIRDINISAIWGSASRTTRSKKSRTRPCSSNRRRLMLNTSGVQTSFAGELGQAVGECFRDTEFHYSFALSAFATWALRKSSPHLAPPGKILFASASSARSGTIV